MILITQCFLEQMERGDDRAMERESYTKVSHLQFLREQSQAYKSKVRREKRRVKKRVHLASHLQQNANVFQLGVRGFSRKAAQNIIWEKNYQLKVLINALKEDNSSLKARLWNFEKENRKMDKQIESWNLSQLFADSRKKPYIDMATVSKVCSDQDYEIVSNKITIAKLEHTLDEREHAIHDLFKKTKQDSQQNSLKAYLLSKQKNDLIHCLKAQFISADFPLGFVPNFLQPLQQSINRNVGEVLEEEELVRRKVELKRKANNAHRQEVEGLMKEGENFKSINEEEVVRMKQTMRKMRLEEQESVKDIKKELKAVQQLVVQAECTTRKMMGDFIRQKIKLHLEMESMLQKMKAEDGSERGSQGTVRASIARKE